MNQVYGIHNARPWGFFFITEVPLWPIIGHELSFNILCHEWINLKILNTQTIQHEFGIEIQGENYVYVFMSPNESIQIKKTRKNPKCPNHHIFMISYSS
jgi:hypothetical protein